MALEDTFISLQSRLYELTDEPSENLTFTLLANSIGKGLEEDLQECKNRFPDLKMVVIDTLQKIRNNIDTKYGADYMELSVLKSIADRLQIAIVLVHHNRKAHDTNPNNLISGTNGIAGFADGLREGDCTELLIKENADPAVPDDEAKGNAFISMVAEMMGRNLAAQGIVVPAFEPTKSKIQAGFTAK